MNALHPALPHEIPAIREIYDQASAHAHAVGTIDWPRPFPVEYLEEYQQAGELFCIRNQQADPIAAIRLSSIPNRNIWTDDTPALYAGKAAVGMAARNQNIAATAILPSIHEVAKDRELSEIRIDCLAHNTRLKTFYEKAFTSRGNVIINSILGGTIELARYSRRVELPFDKPD